MPTTRPPFGASGIEVTATPYAVIFELIGSNPTTDDFIAAAELVIAHVEAHLTDLYATMDSAQLNQVISFMLGSASSPTRIGFETKTDFGPDSDPVPTIEELNEAVNSAFLGDAGAQLLDQLNQLPSDNPFSTAITVIYSTGARRRSNPTTTVEQSKEKKNSDNDQGSAFVDAVSSSGSNSSSSEEKSSAKSPLSASTVTNIVVVIFASLVIIFGIVYYVWHFTPWGRRLRRRFQPQRGRQGRGWRVGNANHRNNNVRSRGYDGSGMGAADESSSSASETGSNICSETSTARATRDPRVPHSPAEDLRTDYNQNTAQEEDEVNRHRFFFSLQSGLWSTMKGQIPRWRISGSEGSLFGVISRGKKKGENDSPSHSAIPQMPHHTASVSSGAMVVHVNPSSTYNVGGGINPFDTNSESNDYGSGSNNHGGDPYFGCNSRNEEQTPATANKYNNIYTTDGGDEVARRQTSSSLPDCATRDGGVGDNGITTTSGTSVTEKATTRTTKAVTPTPEGFGRGLWTNNYDELLGV